MTVLDVQNLTKMYDEKSGILNLNINIKKQDIVLLLGPNGAGKTTAFRGILGLMKVEYDKVDLLGVEVFNDKVKALKKIGAMISKPAFYDYLTGYEHLKILETVYDNVNAERVNHVLKKVGLYEAKDKLVGKYSSGMKQRLDLARAIIHEPYLLVLDEPFNGMDIEAKYDLKKVLKEMQDKNQVGIIISSHMVGDLESFANKVVIIYEGKTLFNGLMSEVRDSNLSLEEFYLEKLNLYKSMEV